MRKVAPARVLWPLGAAVCLSLFGDLTLYAVLPSERQQVGLAISAVGVMLSVNRLIRIPSNALVGALVDRIGRKPVFVVGMLIGSLATLSYGVVRGFWPFLVARLGWGLAWTLLNVSALTMVMDISDADSRGRLNGLFRVWLLAGFAIGPLLGGFLVDDLGFRITMRLYAGLAAMGLIIAFLALPETGPDRRPEPERASTAGIMRRLLGLYGRGLRLIFQDLDLVVLMVAFLAVQFAGEGMALSTINPLLQERFGTRVTVGMVTLGVASASGLLSALRSLVAGLTGPLAGWVSDLLAKRRAVLLGAFALGIAGFVALAVGRSPTVLLLGVLLAAVSNGAGLTVLAARLGDLMPPGQEGVVMGIYATAGDVGSTLGPVVAFGLLPILNVGRIYLLSAFLLGGVALWIACGGWDESELAG